MLIGASSETTLVITPGLQAGFFKTGGDIGSLNPHDYRPNEFVTSDVRHTARLELRTKVDLMSHRR